MMRRPAEPVENNMVVGEYVPVGSDSPDRCAVCHAEEYDMVETYLGKLCSSCSRLCAICRDFMLGEDGVTDSEGETAHEVCARELNPSD
jgi:hypothetical protein